MTVVWFNSLSQFKVQFISSQDCLFLPKTTTYIYEHYKPISSGITILLFLPTSTSERLVVFLRPKKLGWFPLYLYRTRRHNHEPLMKCSRIFKQHMGYRQYCKP